MVHPGFIVAGVVGTVVTGVVLYAIVKEVLETPLVPLGWGRQQSQQQSQRRQQRQQRQQDDQDDQDESDHDRGHSSSVNEGEYELRRRRRRPSEDELMEEKTSDVSTLAVGLVIGVPR